MLWKRLLEKNFRNRRTFLKTFLIREIPKEVFEFLILGICFKDSPLRLVKRLFIASAQYNLNSCI